MKRCLMGFSIAAILLLGCPNFSRAGPDLEAPMTEEEFRAFAPRMIPPTHPYDELIDIENAINLREFTRAVELSDRNIEREVTYFGNDYYGYNIKATSHYYRGYALFAQGDNNSAAIDAYVRAVELGNLGAIQDLSLAFLRRDEPFWAPLSKLPQPTLELLFRTGAALGDEFSSAILGFTDIVENTTEEEKIYWRLLTTVGDSTKSIEERKSAIQAEIDTSGRGQVIAAIKKLSITGGVFEDTQNELPGRDIWEALYADVDLRGTFGRAHGHKVQVVDNPPLAPTISEMFRFFSYLGPAVGAGEPYLLVTGKLADRSRVHYRSAEDIVSNIRPGDRIFVSCTGLSHVGNVYKRDIEKKMVMFADPNYQFWQTTHNTCVTSADLIEEDYKRFLVAISEDDLINMVQAVITMRSKQ